MIIDVLRLTGDRRHENVDVCVIGAGTAGLPLSQSLADRGLNVIVLECGGSPGESLAGNGKGHPKHADPATQQGWVRAIGGSSHIWGGRLIELDPTEIEARPHLGLPGWPLSLSELAQHTSAVESLFQIPAGAFGSTAEWTYETFARPLSGDSSVSPRYPVTVHRRYRDVSRLLRAAGARQPTLYANATVCGFAVDAATGSLQAAEARSVKGNRITICAKHFVLAAGVMESTRLLLWIDRLANGNIFRKSQNLGKYLQDHIDIRAGVVSTYRPRLLSALMGLRSRNGARRVVHFGLSPSVQLSKSLPNAYLNFQISQDDLQQIERVRATAIGSSNGRFQSALGAFSRAPQDIPFATILATWYLLKTSGFRPPSINIVAQIVVEQLPSWNNSISLSDNADQFDVPAASACWKVSRRDEENADSIQSVFSEFWIRSGLSHHCKVQWQGSTTEGLGKSASLFHPCGCIPMGLDPKTSVVDPELNCHDIGNLSVLSTAVFPSAGGGNPTMPLLQLAYRLASSIDGKLRGADGLSMSD